MPLNDRISWDTPLAEVPQALRDQCAEWMRANANDTYSSFDLAVECAHDLELVPDPFDSDDWSIPIYCTELAEELHPDPSP